MRGSLGEKIGEGAFADVHAWAPGQVVKPFKAGVPRRVSWHEARMTRAVFAAGAPAPGVFGEVTLEGRFGIVLSRFDGPTLLQLSRTGAMTSAQTARSSRPSACPFTRRPHRRTYSCCATIWTALCGSPAARFRSTSPLASSP